MRGVELPFAHRRDVVWGASGRGTTGVLVTARMVGVVRRNRRGMLQRIEGCEMTLADLRRLRDRVDEVIQAQEPSA